MSVLFTNCSQGAFEAAVALGDPLLEHAWHIKNTGQKAFATNGGTAGVDLNIAKTWGAGITGRGVKVLISDDGVEDSHQDLTGNYLYGTVSRDYSKAYPYLYNTSEPKTADDNHGTAVAGLVAAVADNGFGSKGVAYGASIVSANFLSDGVTATETTLLDQASGNIDVFNMSWGSKQNTVSVPLAVFQNQLRSGALTLRGGKGAIYVKAAGNFYYVTCAGTSVDCLGNANFDGDNSSPFLILVGALNAKGEAASYSSPGSNVWISSFGGEFGDTDPAMVTTDRSGCNYGFALSNSSGPKFERGANGNIGCSYSVTFNGTSSAAPVLSGVVALLLEANPKLTWRDVKYILAKTAVQISPDATALYTHPLGTPIPVVIYEYPWLTNSAGFKFHNWFGFGRVDVDAAVAYAKKYTSPFGTFIETEFDDNVRAVTRAIPDNSGPGVTDSMTVASSVRIESVQLRLTVSHADISQIAVELTSPSGMKSYLVNMNNSLTNLANYTDNVFLSNAFYQESSAGVWTIKLIDAKAGTTGNLVRWSLRFTGSAN
ncbi:serine protease [Bdellovibrio bacteriovorus]|uniref:Serine protease n=2 Tax=Bdellovibrio bacteriovorus TaxID=959 RepID=A0A150WT15_BDEBC|nr:serine protease [Bdellovibrio bacteriovorus]